MRRINLDQDIKPLSEFRANTAALIKRVCETRRPLVLTQRGHSTAVVVSAAEFERLTEELELLRDVRRDEAELDAGRGIEHEEARRRVLSALGG